MFADVDEHLCLSPESVEKLITPKTRAVMYVGMGGNAGRLNHIGLKSRSWLSWQIPIISEGPYSAARINRVISKEIQSHLNCINESKKIIGYDDLVVHDLPDNKFDSIPILDVIKIVEKEIESYKPDIIFTHHGGDLNIDHQITSRAVLTACRPRIRNKVKLILFFEISYNFQKHNGLYVLCFQEK